MATYVPPYPEKFQPGDIAISLGRIIFTDGTWHSRGQEILVTTETVSYYNVCHKNYDKKESKND